MSQGGRLLFLTLDVVQLDNSTACVLGVIVLPFQTNKIIILNANNRRLL